ncbi:hypothetical protein NA78x_005874 [Anatilimnocola sp. NA78]|uniref:hypothetical protein n=1 Tax=Anatilimnocola sp. NA78 TaxID=3415683 RepID=UPI003CE5C314
MPTPRRANTLIVAIACLLTAHFGQARGALALDKLPRPNLLEIIGRAKVIAIGKIVAVNSNDSYTFAIEDLIRGDQQGQIEIRQIRDSCHQRPFAYAVQQRLIVLLEDTSGKLSPVATYGGETQIDGDQVICHFEFPQTDFPKSRAEFPIRQEKPRALLADMKAALVEFPELVSLGSTPPPPLVQGFRPRQTVKPRTFAARSPVHQLLAAQAKAAGN